jgi:hypothetical protein
MEGTSVRVPAVLARVVRSFAGSRLERELLAQAFALIGPVPKAHEAAGSVAAGTVRDRSPLSASNRKGG